MSANVITNRDGQLSSAVGPNAVRAYGLRMLISALRFEMRTGMKMSRVSALAQAKALTGLKTNKRALHIDALLDQFNAELAKCEIVDEG